MQRLQIGFVHLTAPMLSTAFGHETDVELIIWQWKFVIHFLLSMAGHPHSTSLWNDPMKNKTLAREKIFCSTFSGWTNQVRLIIMRCLASWSLKLTPGCPPSCLTLNPSWLVQFFSWAPSQPHQICLSKLSLETVQSLFMVRRFVLDLHKIGQCTTVIERRWFDKEIFAKSYFGLQKAMVRYLTMRIWPSRFGWGHYHLPPMCRVLLSECSVLLSGRDWRGRCG